MYFLEITDKGIITGLAIGKTKIMAQCIGIHPTTGQSIIYSEVSYHNNIFMWHNLQQKIYVVSRISIIKHFYGIILRGTVQVCKSILKF